MSTKAAPACRSTAKPTHAAWRSGQRELAAVMLPVHLHSTEVRSCLRALAGIRFSHFFVIPAAVNCRMAGQAGMTGPERFFEAPLRRHSMSSTRTTLGLRGDSLGRRCPHYATWCLSRSSSEGGELRSSDQPGLRVNEEASGPHGLFVEVFDAISLEPSPSATGTQPPFPRACSHLVSCRSSTWRGHRQTAARRHASAQPPPATPWISPPSVPEAVPKPVRRA